MYKLATIAAFLGYAAAKNTLMAYENGDTLVNHDQFTMAYYYTADCAWTTQYHAMDSDDGTIHYETYGLNIWGKGNAGVSMEFFKWYKHVFNVQFNLFDITPLAHTTWWTKPYAVPDGTPQQYGVVGSYHTTAGDITSIWIENAKVCGDSFYDAGRDSRAPTGECDYSDQYESVIQDMHLTFDYLGPKLDELLGDKTWYSWNN